jgi:hypothetical protein
MGFLKGIKKKHLVLILFVFGSFYGYFIYALINGKKKHKASAFSGVIQLVTYDTKGIPTIVINGVKIYVGASYNWNNQIEVGDYIEKKKGQMLYKIIKHRNKSVIIFKN